MAEAYGILSEVLPILKKIWVFGQALRRAPQEYKLLVQEARSLKIILKVFKYDECNALVDWLEDNRREQWDDLREIVQACNDTMEEVFEFVNTCKCLARNEAKKKERRAGSRLSRIGHWIQNGAILAFITVKMATTDKQPMRDKIAIPTRALNIYLTSLTFVSMPYNQRLAAGPGPLIPHGSAHGGAQGGGNAPLLEGWGVIGKTIAFKHAAFSRSSLAGTGVERKILLAAERIISGETCCSWCEAGCLCRPHPEHENSHNGRNRSRSRSRSVHSGRARSVSDPLRGRSFIGVIRKKDGTKEIVRSRPQSRPRSSSRARSLSQPRLLTDFAFNQNQ